MAEDRFQNFPLGIWARVRSDKVPYEKMSNLAKCVNDAREAGLSYGQYMGIKFQKINNPVDRIVRK